MKLLLCQMINQKKKHKLQVRKIVKTRAWQCSSYVLLVYRATMLANALCHITLSYDICDLSFKRSLPGVYVIVIQLPGFSLAQSASTIACLTQCGAIVMRIIILYYKTNYLYILSCDCNSMISHPSNICYFCYKERTTMQITSSMCR